jgi:hypothetical protein
MKRRTACWLACFALLAASAPALASGPRRPVVVLDERVRISVDVVTTPAERTQGLSGRPSLGPSEGMLFRFERVEIQTFWMKDMRFEIDLLWIHDGRVVGVTERAKLPVPGQQLPLYRSPLPCDRVLEIPAGSFRRLGLSLGDSVRVEE